MRPSYIVLFVALCTALAAAALGPMRGRSIEAGVADALEATKTTLARFSGDAPASAPQAPKPPELTVSQPVKRDVIEWDEYTGRFDAVEAVEIRARVSGYLTEVKFTDGETVRPATCSS